MGRSKSSKEAEDSEMKSIRERYAAATKIMNLASHTTELIIKNLR
jgi:hypothetical protein